MAYLKLKILFCLTVVSLLFSPFLLEIAPNGKAYAGGSSKANRKFHFVAKSKAEPDKFGYKLVKNESTAEPGNNTKPVPTPEPATMLLFGAGAVGLAALGKKFKRK